MVQLKNKKKFNVLVFVGLFTVGYIDYMTGTELRVFPLYFGPLVLAAWRLGRNAAIFYSLLATIVWAVSMYLAGRHYSNWYIWPFNFVTQGLAFLIVILLVSWLNAALQRERALSRTDALTGLNNSRSFYEQAGAVLSLCQRNMRPATLAYIDLDNFKRVNDTLGHQKGDELLQKAAQIMQQSLRASDVIARLGGDEFAVLLPESSAEEARIALDKVRSRITQAPQFQVCQVSPSIGAVNDSRAAMPLDDLIKAADDLMYQVKQRGKNAVQVQALGA